MRVIPVIDLLDGRAVHAVKGRRDQYRPVLSILCETSDPIALATSFRDRLNLHEIYIADLNAIQDFGCTRHKSVILDLCNIEGMRVILDAGLSDPERAQTWLDLGVQKAVIGSETLNSMADLEAFTARMEPQQLVFSMDLKNGKTLSRCQALTDASPLEILRRLQSAHWREVILLNLDRVGSREGADTTLASRARFVFPDLHLLIGGGVSTHEELVELQSGGIAGVLLATALHNGMIRAEHIAGLSQ